MSAKTAARFEEGLVGRGVSFEAANEENARLYEELGLAVKRKPKRAEPSRTQDVGPEKESPERSGKQKRPRKGYDTKQPEAEDD